MYRTQKECFNTQSPEGGWRCTTPTVPKSCCFSTQPPEGGWLLTARLLPSMRVSTHSRPKAAGAVHGYAAGSGHVSTHSRPKAAGCRIWTLSNSCTRFQHTAARRRLGLVRFARAQGIGFNTQPPEGGWNRPPVGKGRLHVSTHSRPKAAGHAFCILLQHPKRFNTQPPEGGWGQFVIYPIDHSSFNTQPPEGGWPKPMPSGCA